MAAPIRRYRAASPFCGELRGEVPKQDGLGGLATTTQCFNRVLRRIIIGELMDIATPEQVNRCGLPYENFRASVSDNVPIVPTKRRCQDYPVCFPSPDGRMKTDRPSAL